MSETNYEPGQLNGHAIADDDLRDLLDRERQQSKALKQELEQERTQRTRAESAASSAATQRIDAEEAAVDARLSGAEESAKQLRKDYADALAEGRFDDAAEANDKLGALRANQQQDRQYKNWLAGEKHRVSQTQQARPGAEQGQDLSGYTAGQRRWIGENPAFLTDERVRLKTIAGHNLAMANGVAVDSDEYFAIINDTVGANKARRQAEPEEDDGHEGGGWRPSDMPVTRRTQTQPGRAQPVRLTALEREAADTTMPDIAVDGYVDQQGRRVPGRYERYAINREKLRQQGRG